MREKNTKILWGIIALALISCCCVIVMGGCIASYLLMGPAQSEVGERPVIVVTRVMTVTPDAGQAFASPENPASDGSAHATPPAPSERSAVDTEALLREAIVPARDLRDLKMRLDPSIGDIPVIVNATPPSYMVGDSETFWVSNSDTQEHRQVVAELKVVTDHLYMWVERGVTLNQRDLEASAERFETKTYSTNREFFGSEWTPGIDNDVHLSILHAKGLGDTVAGYFSSADEFSRLINPYSNEREMFYISADSGNAKPNSSFYDATLAHEFQHMIHWYQDRNEASWVNEGMSELAAFLNGFDVGGADIAFARKPDTQLTTWSDPSEGNIEHYGASFLFMAYFLDRFGEELTKAIVAQPEDGQAGIDAALRSAGRSERFDDIFLDWLVANFLDEPDASPDGRYGYVQLNPERPTLAESIRRYPSSGDTHVRNYGADYIRLRGKGDVTIEFAGQTETKLVETQPRGSLAWWSNRGDDSNTRLTREFDLSGLSEATLTFSLWYDIEEQWDYAYVEASTDGGKTWTILPGRYTTDENPVGNAFGEGWTGISGGGSNPEWVEEQVDLTAYAGQKIQLRFEYVTDDAVNEPGLLLDDIAIPELGYFDDGETGAPGWQAEGWVLTDNRLQQRWQIRLLTVLDGEFALLPLNIGADGQGQLNLDRVADYDYVVLIISAATPITTAPANYSYSIVTR